MEEGYLSVPNAAAYLGLGIQTTYKMVRSGELPARRHGSRWLVAVADLDAHIERSRVQPGQLASATPAFPASELTLDRPGAGTVS